MVLWWPIRQLSVPMNYLRIRHGSGFFSSKLTYDLVIPFALTTITCWTFRALGVELAPFAHPVMMKRLTDLLALMIVFYMAALAAVATFERKGIDRGLKDEDATLSVRHHDGGHFVTKKLSYRQFVSYLFGYLSFLSLCLYIFIVFTEVFWPQLERHFSKVTNVTWALTKIVDPAIFFVLFFLVWQLVVTSLLGIYFLTERIQTLNDPET